jgi:hypothetical protein
MTWTHYFGIFKATSDIQSPKDSKLQAPYYSRNSMLDEWEVRLYTIWYNPLSLSLSLSRSYEVGRVGQNGRGEKK